MRVFLSFVRKEFFHILRDPWTLVILLLLPMVMLVLFGFAMSTEVKGTSFCVFDPSRDRAVAEIVERLESSGYFTCAGYLRSEGEMEAAFRTGRAGLVLAASPFLDSELSHTRDASVALIVDGSDPNKAKTLVSYATTIISAWNLERSDAGLPSFTIGTDVKLLYNPAMKGAYNFVPGVLGLILLLICAMMTSISIAREKEVGTMEILLVSPIRPLLVILSKTVPYFVLSCMNLATCLLISVFILGVPIRGSLVTLIAISLLYIFLALALGLLISAMVDTQVVALLISGMALMMPVMLLSGMMFPIETMPLPLRLLSNIIPARWYILAVRKVMIKGLGFSSILQEIAILSGMTVVLLAVGLRKFKTRLE